MDTQKKANIEEAVASLFASGTTSTGEEELLRVASKYSMQLTTAQMKCLLYIEWCAVRAHAYGNEVLSTALTDFIKRWLEFKEYNNSAPFIMKVIDFISLRRFLTEQSFKVDIKK